MNLGYIFPDKNYELVKSQLRKNKFFWFEKKISDENYEKIMTLGDKSIQAKEKLSRIIHKKIYSVISLVKSMMIILVFQDLKNLLMKN